ncbi:hypothetical protein NW767_001124 [Fusarium falciforme]|uniref:Prenylcysteine lyase domain-containing protein n=1 Tax=Fusarium falciforme TaxID=195108 RepID=A0A9W8RGA1_9HYPO|nr:hypothetical protein NW755_000330 [Fusarium falciforme]KAJ4209214.1 hypothetical protein NW767_001124 [Fusarium falciforme]
MRLPWSSRLAVLTALVRGSTGAQEVKNVAIIGAGAAGSSAAYYLQRYAEEENLAVNITIFEKTGRIGGRSLTVPAYGDESLPIELGASIFVGVNAILYNATERFQLPVSEPQRLEKGDITAIWDGINFVYQTEEGSSQWWDLAKLFWKYGLAPYKAKKIVDSMLEQFLQLYEPPYFPFKSLTQRAQEMGMTELTGITGEQGLAQWDINPRFSREILQAATRVNYASNLAYIHGLETLVSFATDGAVSVETGNWRIFEELVRASGSTIYRNTTVASIEAAQKKTETSSPKYVISTRDANSQEATPEEYGVAFDNIILANPWQFGNIKAGEGVLDRQIDEIPYTKLHVTLFTSPLKLSPEFFGLKPGSKAPSSVYTTLREDEEPKKGAEGVGSTGFYSVSTLKSVINPKTEKLEYAYKIFSPQPVTAEFLSSLLGTKIPDQIISAKGEDKDADTFEPISWYYPHVFYSYPQELPRVTFEDPIVGDGVYYTSGIESFISTMETSALMGKNVARLVADDFAGITRPEKVAPGSDAGEPVPVAEEAEGIHAQPQEEL